MHTPDGHELSRRQQRRIPAQGCRYCGQAGTTVWSPTLVSCGHETCQALAFAELQREQHHPHDEHARHG